MLQSHVTLINPIHEEYIINSVKHHPHNLFLDSGANNYLVFKYYGNAYNQ